MINLQLVRIRFATFLKSYFRSIDTLIFRVVDTFQDVNITLLLLYIYLVIAQCIYTIPFALPVTKLFSSTATSLS
jgi:hypothetical protein